ncbi:MAG: DNA polymerase III subunit delta', partial [Propionibacteriaceae bacterium]|nr:DNA polymerase III subunit delta' [Propionibacteriaceae bacterium]
MGVFDALIGQEPAVAQLRRAVSGGAHAMTHAWLFTGPPGSGRSVAAKAFAAALQCDSGGCGECAACRMVMAETHPDVAVVRVETLSIKVDQTRRLVQHSSMSPTLRHWQIVILEDVDRITERGADALLRGIEEPGPKTVWLLCAPSPEDVPVTIRSRCRQVALTTPAATAVAALLQSEGVAADKAEWAARVSGGHIGRARLLATEPSAEAARERVLRLLRELASLGACLRAAEELVAFSKEGVPSRPKDDAERAQAKRLQRDAIELALGEYTAYLRDVLVLQSGAGSPLLNAELAEELAALAESSTASATLAKLDAIEACRAALAQNAAVPLALESLFISLRG